MREVFTMWGNTRMVVLTALTAAIYAAIQIPFKAVILIPGFTELRPAAAVPPVFGLLFGPAAAWGSGIGNIIGDFFGGTLSLGSIFGFAGNFFLALTPYLLVDPLVSGSPRTRGAWDETLTVARTVIPASAVCAAIIAWGVDLLGFVPFVALGTVIFVNNILVGIILGPILLRLVRPRVAAWHLLWTDIVDIPVTPPLRRRLGRTLLVVGSVGSLAAGLAIATGVGVGATGITLGVAPLLLVYLVGCILA